LRLILHSFGGTHHQFRLPQSRLQCTLFLFPRPGNAFSA
jgi:hypothetical protein